MARGPTEWAIFSFSSTWASSTSTLRVAAAPLGFGTSEARCLPWWWRDTIRVQWPRCSLLSVEDDGGVAPPCGFTALAANFCSLWRTMAPGAALEALLGGSSRDLRCSAVPGCLPPGGHCNFRPLGHAGRRWGLFASFNSPVLQKEEHGGPGRCCNVALCLVRAVAVTCGYAARNGTSLIAVRIWR